MLSFLFHYLLQTPASLKAIRDEVDRVCGDQPVKFEQLSKLEYIDAALKEALRLKSTAPAFGVTPKSEDQIIGGKYKIPMGQAVMVVLDALHLDPKVWGEDAERFRWVFLRCWWGALAEAMYSLGLNACSMADSRTCRQTAGSHLGTVYEGVSVEDSLGRSPSSSSPWYAPLPDSLSLTQRENVLIEWADFPKL